MEFDRLCVSEPKLSTPILSVLQRRVGYDLRGSCAGRATRLRQRKPHPSGARGSSYRVCNSIENPEATAPPLAPCVPRSTTTRRLSSPVPDLECPQRHEVECSDGLPTLAPKHGYPEWLGGRHSPIPKWDMETTTQMKKGSQKMHSLNHSATVQSIVIVQNIYKFTSSFCKKKTTWILAQV